MTWFPQIEPFNKDTSSYQFSAKENCSILWKPNYENNWKAWGLLAKPNKAKKKEPQILK